MSQVLQTNGNYTIKTTLGGDIVLNTGPRVGQVIVTGNLVVEGETINVEAEQLFIEDNIITVNSGETGSGVTLQYAGIEVSRGSLDNASFVFDESSDTWLLASGTDGTYLFADQSNLKLRNIVFTDPDTVNGKNVRLTSNGIGVLRVEDVVAYEDNVLDDDDIPNKRYVDRRIIENPTYQVVRADSRVTVQDISDPDDPFLLESQVVTVVDNNRILTAYANRVEIQNLLFYTNKIENPSTNENIHLVTSGTGKIELEYAHQYNHIAGTPATVSDATLVYGAAPSPDGGTGVYYVNEDNNGELISKRKALTFSIIF